MTKDEQVSFFQRILKERIAVYLDNRFPVRPETLYYPYHNETYAITEIYITKPKEIEEREPYIMFLEEIIYLINHPIEDSDIFFYCANSNHKKGGMHKYSFKLDEVLLNNP